IRALWRCEGLFADFVKLLLLTGARRTELAGMRRAELENGTWVIPSSRYKTGQEHVVPLSRMALEIIAGLPRVGEEYVFSTNGRTHISGFVKFKDKLDRESGVTGWVLHDCRRTSRTLMSRAAIAPDICERMVGHSMPSLRATYD